MMKSFRPIASSRLGSVIKQGLKRALSGSLNIDHVDAFVKRVILPAALEAERENFLMHDRRYDRPEGISPLKVQRSTPPLDI